ncbi:membrane-binding protein [Acinetobacter sp. WCHAc060025]|uniref:membrane-binding protein n=1 Tax=Acinetobacter sp. WCHAc060025 TaxID=2518625 RepID=UPI001023E36D|nr:membrane-binding protein [Acinetobacter sp. WCHAc060025]RZG72919.1 membrane-binding protein [Acinetobacter sp. WCHAc060025]
MKKLPLFLSSCLLSFTMVGCTSLQSTPSQPVSGKVVTSEAIIAYFAPDAGEEECACGSTMDKGYSLTPVENGYFRKLLGRDQEGRFLLQDFYQSNGQPQTSPFWVKDPKGLNSFDGKYTDGDVIGYYDNGQIEFKEHYKDYMLQGKSELYYKNGQLNMVTEYADDVEVGETKTYYSNGQLASLENKLDEEHKTHKLWYSTGKQAVDLIVDPYDFSILSGKAWDQQGNIIEDEDERQKVIDNIYEQLDTTKN